MSYETELATIKAHFTAGWVNGVHPLTPVQFENDDFQEPKEGPWVRVTIRSGQAQQMSIGAPGGNTHRHPAVVMIQLFESHNRGTSQLSRLGDIACSIFRAKRLDGGIVFFTPTFKVLESEKCWARAMVTAPFHRDELF